jgi:hypothetical protein
MMPRTIYVLIATTKLSKYGASGYPRTRFLLIHRMCPLFALTRRAYFITSAVPRRSGVRGGNTTRRR